MLYDIICEHNAFYIYDYLGVRSSWCGEGTEEWSGMRKLFSTSSSYFDGVLYYILGYVRTRVCERFPWPLPSGKTCIKLNMYMSVKKKLPIMIENDDAARRVSGTRTREKNAD